MDKLYLHSELLWRQGQLPGAMEALHSALASNADSSKCRERLAFLQPIAAELQQASLAMDSGQFAYEYRTPVRLVLILIMFSTFISAGSRA